jgi:UDP-N-acetylglucosamine 2-epimerase (non-hydrolysing)/GDP/UDP-N,N'-diacetylbacillosamine 2-epimerase (hydrolysing)
MRKIGVVTVSRSDYGIYLPVLQAIRQEPVLELCLFVSGTHLLSGFGKTIDLIGADGFKAAERVEMLLAADSPEGIAHSMGMGLIGFSSAYNRQAPDILLVLGDRFEMHAAALAALPFRIPVAHIHGGEESLGAFDNSLRHSITKLSHIHFASTEEYARRIIQMGEEPWRVIVSGAPSLDNLRAMPLLTETELRDRFQVDVQRKFLLVTYHPVTLEYERTGWQINELLAALDTCALPVVFTMPNADTNGRLIRKQIEEFVATHPNSRAFENLGTQGYFSLASYAAAMVGNSSSGIIEAASFKLPVVDIGTRQKGRIHAGNVIQVGYNRTEILAGIKRATDPGFLKKLDNLVNPYGDGHAAERIVEVLRTITIDDKLVYKPFLDIPFEMPAVG